MNTNKLVRFYSYIDGLKTGFTDDAGYCLTATGKRNDMRLISVVMGEENTDKRTQDTLSMLDYGFNMYSIEKLVDSSKNLGSISVNFGKKENVDIKAIDDITVLNNNQLGKKNISYDIITNNVNAPIKSGDIVGKISVYQDNKFLYSKDITVCEDVEKANIFTIFIRNIRDMLSINL